TMQRCWIYFSKVLMSVKLQKRQPGPDTHELQESYGVFNGFRAFSHLSAYCFTQ
ncbi:hypothetical protein Droror1_Dr00021622, partial [Drosera rotundifolia]